MANSTVPGAKYGPIISKVNADPNGHPGQTSGGVPATVSHSRDVMEPTAGSNASIPPYNQSPTLDPLAEDFSAPTDPGPGQ